jgi:hypothetical protein
MWRPLQGEPPQCGPAKRAQPQGHGVGSQYSDCAHARRAAGLLPCTRLRVKHSSSVASMDRTKSTVRKMLTAIEAPLMGFRLNTGASLDRGCAPALPKVSQNPNNSKILRHLELKATPLTFDKSERISVVDDQGEYATIDRLATGNTGFTDSEDARI